MEYIAFILIFILVVFLRSRGVETGQEPREYDFKENKPKEEEFYHPVTGYKGTRSQMDAYIINRERELERNKK